MVTSRRIGAALAAVVLVVSLARPLGAAETATLLGRSRYEFRTEHSPDGIGKFYLGREIAHVLSHQGAGWLERPEREREEHTESLVKALRLRPGLRVADVGCGSGYVTRRLAKQVAPGGQVLALDIQPEMLELLTHRAATAGLTNVVPVLCSVTNTALPDASIDLALLVDVYHEFEFPFEMMQSLCRSLKPGGRMMLVEYRGEDPAVPIKTLHKMTQAQVRKEMAAHPLEWMETIDVLPWQHIIVFRKRTPVGERVRRADD